MGCGASDSKSYKELAKITTLSEQNVLDLQDLFDFLSRSSGDLNPIYDKYVDPAIIKLGRLLFRAADTNRDGRVSFDEFLLCVHALASNDFQKRVEFSFNIYDIDGDGYIQKREFLTHLELTLELMATLSQMANGDKNITTDEPFTCQICKFHFDRFTARFVCPEPDCEAHGIVICDSCRTENPTYEIFKHTIDHKWKKVCPIKHFTPQELADYVFKTADRNRDDRLSSREFKEYAVNHPQVLHVLKPYVLNIESLKSAEKKQQKFSVAFSEETSSVIS